MLRRVRFKNYKSFSKETTLSFEKSRYSILDDINTYNGTVKGCAFYGSNASGKTNALNTIRLLLEMVFGEKKDFSRDITFFNGDETAYFEYAFCEDDDEIDYYFEVNRAGKILRETLNLNGENCFSRIVTSVESHITDNINYDSNDVDEKTLFLRQVYFNTKFKSYPELNKWMDSLSKSLYINPLIAMGRAYNSSPKDVVLSEYLEEYGDDEINEFLQIFKFPYKIEYKKIDLPENSIIPFEHRLQFCRNGLKAIPYELESNGNKVLFNMLPSILTAIKNNSMIIIDEFSSGLHNELEELIIKYFMKNTSSAQLFFVSHSTNLLKTTLLRPDQIYAVDFIDGSSTLSKFSDEHPRESQNLEKMYLAGIFGGIPLYEGYQDK